jgi:GNAT superfamily N-acetyltransferase
LPGGTEAHWAETSAAAAAFHADWKTRVVALEISPQPYGSPVVRDLKEALDAEMLGRYPQFRDHEETADEFDPPEGVFFVGSLDGVAVSCGGLCRLDGETAEIRHMYVAPAARRQGIARRLLRRLLAAALELGYRRVRVETGDAQAEAITLYRSAGFEPIPCWGRYAGEPRSVCLETELEPELT